MFGWNIYISDIDKKEVDKTSYKPQCRSDGRIMGGGLDVQGGPHSYFLNYLGY